MLKLLMLILFALLIIAGIAQWAYADPYTCNGSGCTWSTQYTEPSTLNNNQPLTDLASCTATYTIAIDGAQAGAGKTFLIPASRPSGGQVVTRNNTDATMIPGHTYRISETISCTSVAFGTGAQSAPGMLLMNNGVSPNPPAAPVLQ